MAVCCSSASLSSRLRDLTSSNNRTFSMAITAWSAKVVSRSICFSLNGRFGTADRKGADGLGFAPQWNGRDLRVPSAVAIAWLPGYSPAASRYHAHE